MQSRYETQASARAVEARTCRNHDVSGAHGRKPVHRRFIAGLRIKCATHHVFFGASLRAPAEDIVRIGKDGEKIVNDYKIRGINERRAFERRLREKLHLHHRVVDGVDEFSVE